MEMTKAIEMAQVEAIQANAIAQRHESSLQSLSEAYNTLELEVYKHEEKERKLEARLVAAEERVETFEIAQHVTRFDALSAEALATAREEAYNLAFDSINMKMESSRKDGFEAGRMEALAEGESEMNDLLVCLGQEESKTERLRAKLEEMGVDVDSFLECECDDEVLER
mmetsp:Transcript_22789/g.43568  ORF Transcript_22789/g.43568 Transcript_22789/m.43568 type:complete len:169 (+) Transcript_22789:503-1009(+)